MRCFLSNYLKQFKVLHVFFLDEGTCLNVYVVFVYVSGTKTHVLMFIWFLDFFGMKTHVLLIIWFLYFFWDVDFCFVYMLGLNAHVFLNSIYKGSGWKVGLVCTTPKSKKWIPLKVIFESRSTFSKPSS